MPTVAFIALEEFDRGNADAAQALLESLRSPARFQIVGHWQEIRRNCQRRVTPEIERRRVNGLNVEASGAALDRCLLQSPDGLGLRWWLSGGSILAYGICTLANCPLAATQAEVTRD
ncbi:MAG: hypothetical protein IPK79_00190 [Vampirovibrionales bacterium]|nr:hypothetical protein [Vampirovibrionales bacterium]